MKNLKHKISGGTFMMMMVMTMTTMMTRLAEGELTPRFQYEYFHRMQYRPISFGEEPGPLEDRNLLPGLEMQVIVDGEQHHEVQEEGGGRQEVPDVVLVVKVE